MGVKLNTASGGSVSIEPTNTASNYTLTVPAQTGTVVASDSSGNVGIGTSSPSVKLHVVGGQSYVTGALGSGAYSRWYNNAQTSSDFQVGQGWSSASDNVAVLNNNANAAMIFGTNGTERMRIDSSGNLLVGTTTNRGRLTTESPNDFWSYVSNQTGSGTFAHMRFMVAGTAVGAITSNTTTTTYATSSDYRLKENIAPMTGALDTVSALKPVTYTWKADGSAGQGFIAHELQEVVPDCVTGEKDAVETYIDEEGVEQTRPVYQGIDTSFLVATLTAAIQELNADLASTKLMLTEVSNKVDAQAAEIALLKGQA